MASMTQVAIVFSEDSDFHSIVDHVLGLLPGSTVISYKRKTIAVLVNADEDPFLATKMVDETMSLAKVDMKSNVIVGVMAMNSNITDEDVGDARLFEIADQRMLTGEAIE